jgi:hypothetical protein
MTGSLAAGSVRHRHTTIAVDADRPLITTPRHLQPGDVRQAEAARLARQPGLGLTGGLLFVVPFTVLFAFGAGGANGSVLVLAPLTTFALPVVAVIAFWWDDWPGTRLQRAWAGWADTVLVAIGAVVLTMAGQAATARLDLAGIFAPGAGPRHAATFPATMPLAGAAFVAVLQLTLACERWPLTRFSRTWSGVFALVIAWAMGLLLAWTVVTVTDPAGSARTHSGLMKGSDFGALMVITGMWQTVLFVVLHGWPLNAIRSRGLRLLANNAAVIGGALGTYWLLSAALGLAADLISAACGCVIAGGLLVGMLFDGWPRRAGRFGTLALVAVAAAVLFSVLTALAGTVSWHRATAADWVSYVGLNAIGLPVILHVGIGRRWPFRSVSVPKEGI